MIQILITLIDFYLNPLLIPSHRYQMSQKIILMLIKSIFENAKHSINGLQASCLLFKYYVNKLGVQGVLVCADITDPGGEVQNYGKHANIIIEHFLTHFIFRIETLTLSGAHMKKIGSKSQKLVEISRFENLMKLRFHLGMTQKNTRNSLIF